MTEASLRFTARDDGTIAAQVRRVNAQLESFQNNAQKAAGAIGGAFKVVGAFAAVATLGKIVNEAVDFADNMVRVSAQTGIAIEKLQQLNFVAEQADVGFDSLTGAVARLQRALVNAEEGQKASTEALKNLNINVAAFMQMKPDEQFESVAVAIAAIPDPAERTARAMDLFGRSGAELIPLMTTIAEQSDEIGIAFTRIGGPVGEDAIRALDDMGDAASAVGLAAKNLSIELLALAAPAITAGLEVLQAFFGGLRIAIIGSSDAIQQLDAQIEELQAEKEGARGTRGTSAANQKAGIQAQIDALMREQRRLLGLDDPVRIPFDVANPLDGGGPKFEETDEQAKARQKVEDDRLDANERRAEEALKRSERGIDAEMEMERKKDAQRIQEALARESQFVGEKLRINTEAADFLAAIRETFNLKEIQLEEIKNQSIFGLATGLFADLAGANTKFAKLQQGIAIAQTVWYTATGIMNAFRSLPWPASIIAAGKVALTGAIQVAKIKSTNYSGGGSAPTVSGGSSVSSAEQGAPSAAITEPAPRSAMNVFINGVVTHEVIDQLLDGMRDAMDRDVVIIPNGSRQASEIRGSA